jgi:hypothetical protein
MIHYLKQKNIDRAKWDNCVVNSQLPLVYAESWYLDCVSPNWNAFVLDDYKAVMPLPVNSKFNIKFLAQPFYCQQLGVFSLIEDDFTEFYKNVHKYFPFGWYSYNESDWKSTQNIDSITKVTCKLLLNKPYEELFKAFSQNTRRNIKKANSFNIQLDENVTIDEFIALTKQNAKTEIKPKHYEALANVIKNAKERNRGFISGCRNESGNLLAAVFWLNSPGRWIFLSANSSEEGSKQLSMFALVDNFIRKHAESDCCIDFEGSVIEGVARFYLGFGAEKHYFSHIKFNHVPFPFKFFIPI